MLRPALQIRATARRLGNSRRAASHGPAAKRDPIRPPLSPVASAVRLLRNLACACRRRPAAVGMARVPPGAGVFLSPTGGGGVPGHVYGRALGHAPPARSGPAGTKSAGVRTGLGA